MKMPTKIRMSLGAHPISGNVALVARQLKVGKPVKGAELNDVSKVKQKRHGIHHGAGLSEGHSVSVSEKAQFAEAIVAAAHFTAGGHVKAAVKGVAVVFADLVTLEHGFRHFDGLKRVFASRICTEDVASRCG